jgi:hypothetical protein
MSPRASRSHCTAAPVTKMGPLEREGGPPLTAQLPGDGGQKSCARAAGLVGGVHEEERAGAVGVLDQAGCNAGLAEGRGLLIARHPGDGDGRAEEPRLGRAEDVAVRLHLGEQCEWDVEEERPGGVRDIGRVHRA